MGIVFKNNAKTTLASSLSNSATSATVTDGSVFPSLSAGEFFLVTFDDGTNHEICKCTARSGNTLTIVRAQESTTARAFSSGDAAEGRVTAGVLETIQENIAAKSANQTVFNTTTSGGATTYNIGTNPGVEANAMVFLNGVLQHHDTLSFSGTNLTFDAAPANGLALEVIIDNLINLQSSNLTVDSFTAADVSGSPQTDFTLSDTPAAETNLIVFIDGVFQDQDAYTISSNTLTITTGVIAGRGVTVYVINPVNIGTPSDSTVTSAKLSGNITMPGTLTVGSNDVAFDSPTFVVDNANSRVGLGTASPSVPVDIVGDVKMSADLTVDTSTLKVDSSNNRVGVGTASPSVPLHVSGEAYIDSYLSLRTTDDQANRWLLYTHTNDNLEINYNGAGNAEVVIDTSGSVGVGTTSPSSFHSSVLPLIVGSGSGDEGMAIFSGSSNKGKIGFADTAEDGSGSYRGYLQYDHSGDNLNIGTAGSEKMRLDSAGKLGIGTGSSDPDTKLHVKDTGGIELRLEADSNNSGQEDCFIRFYTDGKTQEGIAGMDNNNSSTLFSGNTENAMVFGTVSNLPVVLATNNTERWQVEAGGKFYGTGTIQANTILMGGSTLSYGGASYGYIGTNSTSARFGYFRDSSNNYPAMIFNTGDDCHFSPHDSGVQVYFGSQGGDFGGNSSHNVRASSNLFMFNGGGSSAQIIFEVNGANRGTVTSSSSSGVFSDREMKEDIQDIEIGKNEILQLKPRRFKYKTGAHDTYGFIAQEVEEVIPLSVGEAILPEPDVESGKDTIKTLDMNSIFTGLVKAFQEQELVIQDLKARIEELEG